MITILAISVSSIICFILGRMIKKSKLVTVYDNFTPNKNRTEMQLAGDAVLKLQNEIVESGALKIEEMKNGDYYVKLTLVK